MNHRQFNAIIEGANIIEALATPHRPAAPGMGLATWLDSDDTGASSICEAQRGMQPKIARRDVLLSGEHAER